MRAVSAIPHHRRQGPNRRALRYHRTHAQWDNWMKDLRTEILQLIYEQPVYPKNLYIERPPFTHAEFRKEVIEKQIDRMIERDIRLRPGAR